MNVSDKSGISKFNYNGLDFYSTTTTINSIISNATVRAYDKFNNYSDIKCKSEYGTGFRNINVDAKGHLQGKSGYIKCGTSVSRESMELDQLMQSYGYKTRDAVAAAAVYLVNYKYNISYFWGGKTDAKGFDTRWGCRMQHTTEHPCTNPLNSNSSACEYGLDCAGFTRWAFIQAGFSTTVLRAGEQTTGMWGNFNPNKHKYRFNSVNTAYINQIKPGDIIHREGHVGLIIGVSADKLQVAEMLGPLLVTTVNKSNGASLSGQVGFTDFDLMDEFYKTYGTG